MLRRLLIALLLIAASAQAMAQVNNEKYRDLFLVGDFGEVCTMCEVVVLCVADETIPANESIPASGSFTLYYLQTRTFWSQITTIWEWFIANFNSESLAQGHDRPVWIYTINAGNWSGPTVADAWIALEPPLLTFGESSVDRNNQAWINSHDATPLGFCQRLPLWDALDSIALHSGTGNPP